MTRIVLLTITIGMLACPIGCDKNARSGDKDKKASVKAPHISGNAVVEVRWEHKGNSLDFIVANKLNKWPGVGSTDIVDLQLTFTFKPFQGEPIEKTITHANMRAEESVEVNVPANNYEEVRMKGTGKRYMVPLSATHPFRENDERYEIYDFHVSWHSLGPNQPLQQTGRP